MPSPADIHFVLLTEEGRIIAGAGGGKHRMLTLTGAENEARRQKRRAQPILSLGETSEGLLLMPPGALDDEFVAKMAEVTPRVRMLTCSPERVAGALAAAWRRVQDAKRAVVLVSMTTWESRKRQYYNAPGERPIGIDTGPDSGKHRARIGEEWAKARSTPASP